MLRTIKRRITHLINLSILFIMLSCLVSCTTTQSHYSGQYIHKPLDYSTLLMQEKALLGIDALYSPDKQKFLMTDKVSNFNTILVNRDGHYDVIFDFKLHFGEHAVRDMYAMSYAWKDNGTVYVFNTYADPYPELLEINVLTKQTNSVTLPVDGYLVDYSYVSGNFLFQHYNNSEARSYSLYNLTSNSTIDLPQLENMNLHQLHQYDKFFFLNTQSAQSPVVFDLATSKLYPLTLPTTYDVTYPLVSFLPEQKLVSVLVGNQLHIIDYTSNQTATIINLDHIEDINNSSFIKWTTTNDNPCFYTSINLVCKQ